MDAANSLLRSLRDFGWPVLAYAIFAPISTFVLPSNRTRQEQVQRLLLVGAIIVVIEALFFLGTESGDALEVARLHPAWGVSASMLILVAVGVSFRFWLLRARENRAAISISEPASITVPTGKLNQKVYLTLISLWLLGAAGSLIWLWQIAAQ